MSYRLPSKPLSSGDVAIHLNSRRSRPSAAAGRCLHFSTELNYWSTIPDASTLTFRTLVII